MDIGRRRRPKLRALMAGLLIAATFLATIPAPAAADSPIAAVDHAVRQIASSNPNAKVRVILQGNPSTVGAAATRHGGRVIGNVDLGGGVSAEVPASEIAGLAREAGLKRVAYDAPVVGHGRLDTTLFDAASLATIYPLVLGSANLWSQGITGKNVGVAFVDSGISRVDDFSADKGSRVVVSKHFGASPNNPGDNYGHGTAVAGVAGGNGQASDGRYVGTAPGVDLISLKVGNGDGARISDVMNAIFWAVKNKSQYNIRVMNISLTSVVPETYHSSLLDMAVEYAWFNGIVVVVSAGNGCADDKDGKGCKGSLYPPANDPFVITVGATDDFGTAPTKDDVLAYFSRYNAYRDCVTANDAPVCTDISKPDVVAPGRKIVTTLSSVKSTLATLKPDRIVDSNYIRLSGTSLSSAEVSGVVAQLLQARPDYRPDQVKWLLGKTANRVTGPGTGAGYPDASAAVKYKGKVESANARLLPNFYLLRALGKVTWDGVSWDGVSWDGVSWDGVSWDGVSWDGVSWDGVSWDGVSWDGVSWDGVSWDGVSWD